MRLSQYGVPVFKSEGQSSLVATSLNSASSYQQLFTRERCCSSCHEQGTKKKFWVSVRNRTSDLRIPCSDASHLSHRDSTVSEVYYEVHDTRTILVTPFAIFQWSSDVIEPGMNIITYLAYEEYIVKVNQGNFA